MGNAAVVSFASISSVQADRHQVALAEAALRREFFASGLERYSEQASKLRERLPYCELLITSVLGNQAERTR